MSPCPDPGSVNRRPTSVSVELALTFLVTFARSSLLLWSGREVVGRCYHNGLLAFAIGIHRRSTSPLDPTSEQAGSVRHRPAKEDQLTFWYFGWSSRGSSTEGGSCSVFMRCMYGNVPATAMCYSRPAWLTSPLGSASSKSHPGPGLASCAMPRCGALWSRMHVTRTQRGRVNKGNSDLQTAQRAMQRSFGQIWLVTYVLQ